jgi:hypothetical protein
MSKTFVVEIESPLRPDEVRRQVLTKLSVPLGKVEYRLENQNETMIAYARTYRPHWLLAVLLFWLVFPLLLLLIVETDRVVVTLIPEGGGTRIVVVGDGPAGLRRQFDQLTDPTPQT